MDEYDTNALSMYDLYCEIWGMGDKYVYISQGSKELCFIGKIVEVGKDYLQLDTGDNSRGNIFIPFNRISYFRVIDPVLPVRKD